MKRAFLALALAIGACDAYSEAPATPADAGQLPAPDGATEPPAADGAAPVDAGVEADAGERCTGTVLKEDVFEARPAVDTGWDRDYAGDAGVIEIANAELHVAVPPAVTAQSLRRHLTFSRAQAKRICVSFAVRLAKPENTTGYFGNGTTTFALISAQDGDDSPFLHGLRLTSAGPIAFAYRVGTNDDVRALPIDIGARWSVLMDADYERDTLRIVIDGRTETMSLIRPSPSPDVTISIGLRNFGPAPEAEAFVDDVRITIP